MNIFDIHTQYEHEETPNNLKVALIQQKELSADRSGQTIFGAAMVHFQNWKPGVRNYFKVIQNAYNFCVILSFPLIWVHIATQFWNF